MHWTLVLSAIAQITLVTASPIEERGSDLGVRATESYEYIVVGSGPGGGPLAANLARAGHSVLLLEAGDDEGANIDYQVPAFQGRATEDDLMAWNFFVKHYKDDKRQMRDPKFAWRTPSGTLTHSAAKPPAGSKPLGILYPRSAQLGGCGAHNALIAMYGHQSDWDDIATLTGDKSWSSDNMRNVFTQLENAKYPTKSLFGHGVNGYLSIDQANPAIVLPSKKVVAWIASALGTLGLGGSVDLLGDANSPSKSRDTTQGVYQIPLTSNNGARVSSREYILDTINAKNFNGSKKYPLTLKLNSLVTKVLFETKNNKPTATGVQYLAGRDLYKASPQYSSKNKGTKVTVKATREVILSGGAYNSPQLLKLSGVGPAAELKKFNIPVVKDLPGVGSNLQDHYESAVISKSPTPFTVTQNCTFAYKSPDPCLEQWKSNSGGARGIYQSSGFAVGVFQKTSAAPTADTDTFLYGGPIAFQGYYPNYSRDAVSDAQHWTWAIIKSNPKSQQGTVKLTSNDPTDTPAIQYNYFDTGAPGYETDLEALADAITLARDFAANYTAPTKDDTFAEQVPGRAKATRAELKQWVQDSSWGHHASCSNPIGKDGDPMAVLDSKFRVRGVNNLRVVDASSFPRVPGFFIQIPTYQLSQKASNVILQDLKAAEGKKGLLGGSLINGIL